MLIVRKFGLNDAFESNFLFQIAYAYYRTSSNRTFHNYSQHLSLFLGSKNEL